MYMVNVLGEGGGRLGAKHANMCVSTGKDMGPFSSSSE